MGGELAVIFIIASITDMVRNHCPDDGCLALSATAAQVWLQPGMTYLDNAAAGAELTVGLDVGRRYGPFQPVFAASIGDEGEVWIGFGAHWRSHDEGWFADALLMPGLYDPGAGDDIGHVIEFRSSLGIGYGFDSGAEMVLSLDHRSNNGLADYNPGLETISLRFSMPLR